MLNRSFAMKCFRNFVFRNTPFFAHFFVTERCNLRCAYCRVYQHPTPELDEAGCKAVIDRLEEMGVAVLSFTGGEPLLRKDLPELIEYAKEKHFLVKITSNGTLPRSAYTKLLRQPVDSIQVSMDGIGDKSELPYSKIDPRIMDTIRYLYENRTTQKIYVSTLYHNGNTQSIRSMVDTLHDQYPSLRIFVQPIVTGDEGHFRAKHHDNVNPSFLYEISDYSNVVNPRYFNRHCQRLFETPGGSNWGCKAGNMFFDIKPNGDFWMCQDKPTQLNILDDDFMTNWKCFDFEKLKRNCLGCTYSCYVITQRAFELKNSLTWFEGAYRL